MNRNMRLVVSVLFIVIIVLAVAITRFYSKTEKTAYNGAAQPSVDKQIRSGSDADGNRIFQDGSGLFGIIDSSERIIVSPEWNDIAFTDGRYCTASKRLKNRELTGCIDYEGNITVPFVYSGIEPAAFPERKLFFATTADDGSCAVYDENFTPCFPCTWKNCRADGENLILETGQGTYKYRVSASGIEFKEASVKCIAGDILTFNIELTDPRLLSKLTPQIIEAVSRDTGGYLEFAYTRRETAPDEKPDSRFSRCTPLFPDEKDIEPVLSEITELRFKNISVESDSVSLDVSFKGKTDVYYKENGKPKQLSGEYRAELRFAGSSAADLHITTGGFRKQKPDYPAPEPEEEQEEPTEQNG